MKKKNIKLSNYLTSTFLIILFLTLFGFLLRVLFLDNFPNGFARDEAYLGYNAYSILITGKDINGNFLPLFIESFLYTPAGYSYLSIPFIKIFGLSIFSVRFASALFGAVSIPLIYLFVREIFGRHSFFISNSFLRFAGILTSALLAINAWHINLSRTASVSTVVMFFILLGSYFLALWMNRSEIKFLFLAFLALIVSLFFYIAPFSFLPFFLLGFFFTFRNKIKTGKKYFFVALLLILLPIILTYTNKDFSLRVQSLSLSKHPIIPIILTENANRDGVSEIKPLISRVFHNKVSVIGNLYTANYFNHFNYDFLFGDKGFPDRYRVPESGLIYPILLIFLIFGLVIIFKIDKKVGLFLAVWILISPIGSSFANDDVPNMQRTLFMLPPILIIISVGLLHFVSFAKSRASKALLCLTCLILIYQIAFYFHQYYVHLNSYRPWYRQEGYERLVEKISIYEGNYKKVVVTNRESAPTLFLSFFKKYDPIKLQEAIKSSDLRDTDRISFDKYKITEEECPVKMKIDVNSGKLILTGDKETLYINSGFCKIEELPQNVRVLESFKRTDGSTAFYILDLKNK